MYKKGKVRGYTRITRCEVTEGEPIEHKIKRIVEDKEPISDSAPIIFTERKDGVLPGYDIRTDRWDIALDAMDRVSRVKTAQREGENTPKKDDKKGENDKVEPIQATEPTKTEKVD
jgi:hypothetical protein